MVANDHNRNRSKSFCELGIIVLLVFPLQPNDCRFNNSDHSKTFILMLERKVEAGRKRKKDMSKWSVYFNSLDPLLEW